MEIAVDESHSAFDADVRDGEKPRTWYRGERNFMRDGQWFIQTREGVDVGPYKCQFDAELESADLIRKLRHTPQTSVQRVIHSHVTDAQLGPRALNSNDFTDYLVETGGVELLRREGF